MFAEATADIRLQMKREVVVHRTQSDNVGITLIPGVIGFRFPQLPIRIQSLDPRQK